MAKKSKKKNMLRRPALGDVEGRKPAVPAGEYMVQVKSVESIEGDKAEYWKWTFEITEGKHKGSLLYLNTSLAEQALWNLKGLLEALGVEDLDDEGEDDADTYVGLACRLQVEVEKYEGRPQARVVNYAPVDGDGEEDEGEEEEEDEKPAKKSKSERRKERRASKRTKDEGEEEEEEEEDEPKSKKKSGKKGKPKKVARGEILDMDEDELGEFIEEHSLEIDLSEYKTLKKMKNAVIDAADDAGILGD